MDPVRLRRVGVQDRSAAHLTVQQNWLRPSPIENENGPCLYDTVFVLFTGKNLTLQDAGKTVELDAQRNFPLREGMIMGSKECFIQSCLGLPSYLIPFMATCGAMWAIFDGEPGDFAWLGVGAIVVARLLPLCIGGVVVTIVLTCRGEAKESGLLLLLGGVNGSASGIIAYIGGEAPEIVRTIVRSHVGASVHIATWPIWALTVLIITALCLITPYWIDRKVRHKARSG